MAMNDLLASALSKILNSEKAGKLTCEIPSSTIIKKVLTMFNEQGYLGDFNEIKKNNGNLLEVNLLKNINKCGVIKPRYPVGAHDIEKFEKRFLPAKDFGFLIISTNKGLLIHSEAKSKNLGGKLIAYCY